MQYYVFGGLLGIIIGWTILKNRIGIKQLVGGYLLIAPLYVFTIVLVFWKYSVTNFVWLIPIPIGAYVFFSSKEVVYYSLYALIIIIAASILANHLPIPTIIATKEQIKISDIFLFISNVIIASHFMLYKDKVRSLQIIDKLEKQEKIELPVSLDPKALEHYKSLFDKIEQLMKEEQIFKQKDLSVTSLSALLKVSTSYISRAIRYSDYSNFNSYLNFYRIEFVVELLHSVDLEKVTLQYVYTEAGYKNQSTFNNAFKSFKGVTPSEYIQNLEDYSK
ncbi:AraC family transcriptional regulator [Chishuiella changwenlii]|uniref:helix-turn-helix domain-containing protein n=1 Tax=Chishuiella changwenlii TaxID=1434701 RepID=UPI002FD8CC14